MWWKLRLGRQWVCGKGAVLPQTLEFTRGWPDLGGARLIPGAAVPPPFNFGCPNLSGSASGRSVIPGVPEWLAFVQPQAFEFRKVAGIVTIAAALPAFEDVQHLGDEGRLALLAPVPLKRGVAMVAELRAEQVPVERGGVRTRPAEPCRSQCCGSPTPT